MSNEGEIIKVGQFTPNPNRHQGFKFIDQGSGIGLSLEDLNTDPQDPDVNVAMLNTFYEGSIVVPPLIVFWQKSLIREAEPFVATVEQQPAVESDIVSKIAVGSLVVQLKRH